MRSYRGPNHEHIYKTVRTFQLMLIARLMCTQPVRSKVLPGRRPEYSLNEAWSLRLRGIAKSQTLIGGLGLNAGEIRTLKT